MVSKDVEMLEDMLTSLVDLLVEKGIITQKEYEAKVRSLLEESAGLTRFDDLKE
jgi:polyhydroxyalkanoate synthesis regulator phasin